MQTSKLRQKLKKYNNLVIFQDVSHISSSNSIFQEILQDERKDIKRQLQTFHVEGAQIDGDSLTHVRDMAGWTLAHYAVFLGRLDLLNFLVERAHSFEQRKLLANLHIDIKSFGISDWSLAHAACEANQADCLHVLIDHGANCHLNMQVCRGPASLLRGSSGKLPDKSAESDSIVEEWTPLHICCIQNSFECAKLLLDRAKVLVDSRSRHRKTPLMFAVQTGQLNLVQLLLERGANPNADSARHNARPPPESRKKSEQIEHTEQSEALIRRPLYYAAKRGDAAIIRVLLEAGAEPSQITQPTPLIIACSHAAFNVEAVKLLANAVSLSAEKSTAHSATTPPTSSIASRNYLECRSDSVKRQIRGGTALVHAFLSAAYDPQVMSSVKYLVEVAGADINVTFEYNSVAGCNIGMMIISRPSMSFSAKLLIYTLQHGLDINHADDNGTTLLMMAVANNALWLIDYLMERNVNVNFQSKFGLTALLIAIKMRNNEIIKKLLTAAPNLELCLPSQLTNHEYAFAKLTCLHWAIRNSDLIVSKLIVERGGDLHATCSLKLKHRNSDVYKWHHACSCLHLCVAHRSHVIFAYLMDLIGNGGAPVNSSHPRHPERQFDGQSLLCAVDESGYSLLHFTVLMNDRKMAARLLSNPTFVHTMIDAQNEKKETAIMLATKTKNREFIRILLRAGANPNITDQIGCNVLHYAIMDRYTRTLADLYLEYAEFWQTLDQGEAVLHTAAIKEAMTLAKEQGCCTEDNDDEESKLHALELMSTVKCWRAESDQSEPIALHTPLGLKSGDDSELISTQFLYKLNVNQTSNTWHHRKHISALMLALEMCDAKSTQRLLSLHALPNQIFVAHDIKLTPIFLISEFYLAANLEKMIEFGADIHWCTETNETALNYALRYNRVEMAERLIELGVRLDLRATSGTAYEIQPIHIAAQNGLTSLLQLMMEYGASLNTSITLKSVERVNALHLAALNDLTDTVKELVRLGCPLNSTRSDTFTALLTLVSKRNVAAVRFLLERGADINCRCVVSRSSNATCLHIAAQLGSLEMVRVLLEFGADPMARMATGNRDGIQPVHLAAESGQLEIVRLFVERTGISVDAAEDDGLTCLHYAANAGRLELVAYLLEAGADVAKPAQDFNRSAVLPIHMAAEKGHRHIVQLLLSYASPIDAVFSRGNTPVSTTIPTTITTTTTMPTPTTTNGFSLMGATHASNVETIPVSGGGDASMGLSTAQKFRGNLTALYIAVYEQRTQLCQLLVEAGARLDIAETQMEACPLHIATQRGNPSLCYVLVGGGGACVNARLSNGITPLHLAAEKGAAECAFWLIRHGARVSQPTRAAIQDCVTRKTSGQITPLNQACGFGHVSVVRMLLGAGADPTSREVFEGHHGIQPIHCAAIRGKSEVVRVLLARRQRDGASDARQIHVDAQDDQGRTGLHWTVIEGFYECASELIRLGADPCLRDNHGKRPIDYATTNDLSGLLRNAMNDKSG